MSRKTGVRDLLALGVVTTAVLAGCSQDDCQAGRETPTEVVSALLTETGPEATVESVCEYSGEGFESKTSDWLNAVREQAGGADAASDLTVRELTGEQMARNHQVQVSDADGPVATVTVWDVSEDGDRYLVQPHDEDIPR
ncbi:hypothetical protein I6I18_12170 [Kytococcus sedentarius]|uniref:Lipoprotein n=1 Tax=Kytococcus sedentarius (strain ATCC 14392 / DSM 20547 / JCM 11482 / CCUG 33030 / NBRC 15357 / NCTC 11040 / CCM 314 / 541) TaxID=478801 RepID=C7NJF3_KYTSD|nr:hypothetical protein [Kytococcus sedentarius]ACV05283.1 hypothetical protein Ksed_01960 [Kytococcus sedentarius DSM 20547]QQB63737.1 hypothetical protein I6I18_12170 [Kytococcus sedentarius]STX13309.1 Uncharacterised protein [Kytococcus sedentarius]